MIKGAVFNLVLLTALLVTGSPVTAALSATVQKVEVKGATFHLTLDDGQVMAQDQLPGVVLVIGDGSGQQRRVRIDAVEADPKDPAGEVMLYAFSAQDAASGEWRNLCEPDPAGQRHGFPLAGAFTSDGQYVATPGRFFVTCTSGAEGKCVRFGYKPWRQTPTAGSLAPYYQACVRMVRADYCGDGVGHTRNGTLIDLFDRVGIQQDESAPGMTFEAAWGPDGAVCVRHTRLSDVLAIDALAKQCPRLAGHLGDVCEETTPALLFNRSFGH